jgi:hypothetical protein
MRKLLFVGLLLLGLAFTISARQRAAAPSFAPVPASHAAPSHAPAAPARPSPSHVALPANKATALHQKPIPRPTNIIVNPVSSITTTATCNRHFSYPILGFSGCSPAVGASAYGGAYFIPVPYYYGDTTAEEVPPGPGDVPQLAANEQSEQPPLNSEGPAPAAVAPRTAFGNINETLAEFVFVNRDGTKFNAVAYSFLKDKLHYVTKEGVRHTASLDSLDLQATQKLNEQLGNTINLPGVPAEGLAQNLPPPTLN